MSLIRTSCAALALLACLLAGSTQAQEPARLRIEGLSPQAQVLTLDDLRKLRRTALDDKRGTGHDGKPTDMLVHYNGVLLSDLLEQAGFAKLDPRMRRRSAVFAIASDGYQAAYSWGEIFNSEAGARMLVIDEKEGRPLDAADGPIGIAALGDRNPAPRHVKRLVALKVVVGAP